MLQGCQYAQFTLLYVPSLLLDELLYSFLGRLFRANAFVYVRGYIRALFGSAAVIPSVDFPTRIESVQRNLGEYSPFKSARQIMETATLLPYHRPFLLPDRAEKLEDILLNGEGKRLKTLIGRVANRFGASAPMRNCPKCLEEEIADIGVPYWKRMHHPPGVISCPIHGVELTNYAWPSLSTDRQRLVNLQIVPNLQVTASPASQVSFAKLSNDLLTANLPAIPVETLQCVYQEAVASRGFCNRHARVDIHALAEALRQHYDDFEGFEHRARLLSSDRNPVRWVGDMFVRSERALHPICHLLLIGFLFRTIDTFRHALCLAQPAERAGFGCAHRNLLSRTQSKQSQKSLRTFQEYHPVDHDNVTKSQNPVKDSSVLSNQSLSCRKAAELLGVSTTTVVNWRRAMEVPISERRKHLTPGIITKVVRMLGDGLPSREVAHKNSVSVATVNRLRSEFRGLRQLQILRQLENRRKRMRDKWLAKISRDQSAELAKARRNGDSANYAWLYRHDREWLLATNRRFKRPRQNARRVNWAARDLDMVRKLRMVSHSMRLRPKRPRISKTLLLRTVGDAMVRANLPRLPRVNRALGRLAESIEQFRVFRVRRAIEQLSKQHIQSSVWRIKRVAGIRRWTKQLDREARKLIASMNAKATT